MEKSAYSALNRGSFCYSRYDLFKSPRHLVAAKLFVLHMKVHVFIVGVALLSRSHHHTQMPCGVVFSALAVCGETEIITRMPPFACRLFVVCLIAVDVSRTRPSCAHTDYAMHRVFYSNASIWCTPLRMNIQTSLEAHVCVLTDSTCLP
eukprot:5350316-Alexandrium_andersonii.AAC.1